MDKKRTLLKEALLDKYNYDRAEKIAFIHGWNLANANPDWRDAKEDPPQDSGTYLVYDGTFQHIGFYYEACNQWWNDDDGDNEPINAMLWMPLPRINLIQK
jgi:hypothetical protein